jgi:hypothetical protein
MQWTINSLSTLNTPEVQTAVLSNFTVSDTQNGLSGYVTYSVNLLPASVSNFTPYSQITQAQAVQWTKDALGTDRVASIESQVQKQIDAQKVPTPQPMPVPWLPPTTA